MGVDLNPGVTPGLGGIRDAPATDPAAGGPLAPSKGADPGAAEGGASADVPGVWSQLQQWLTTTGLQGTTAVDAPEIAAQTEDAQTGTNALADSRSGQAAQQTVGSQSSAETATRDERAGSAEPSREPNLASRSQVGAAELTLPAAAAAAHVSTLAHETVSPQALQQGVLTSLVSGQPQPTWPLAAGSDEPRVRRRWPREDERKRSPQDDDSLFDDDVPEQRVRERDAHGATASQDDAATREGEDWCAALARRFGRLRPPRAGTMAARCAGMQGSSVHGSSTHHSSMHDSPTHGSSTHGSSTHGSSTHDSSTHDKHDDAHGTYAYAHAQGAPVPPAAAAIELALAQWAQGRAVLVVCPRGAPMDDAGWACLVWGDVPDGDGAPSSRGTPARTGAPAAHVAAHVAARVAAHIAARPESSSAQGAMPKLCGQRFIARLYWKHDADDDEATASAARWWAVRTAKQHGVALGRQLRTTNEGAPPAAGAGHAGDRSSGASAARHKAPHATTTLHTDGLAVQLGPVLLPQAREWTLRVRIDAVQRLWAALDSQWSLLVIGCDEPLLPPT